MYRLLFVGGPSDEANQLLVGLRRQGSQDVIVAHDLQEVSGNHDLVILELSHPAAQESLAHFSGESTHSPIIALMNSQALSSRRAPLGVDDFMLLPGSVAELMARIELLMVRFGRGSAEDRLVFDDLVIDLAGYEVTLGGQPIDLTYKEYELLRFLASRSGRVFTREALLSQVWGYDYFGGSRTVDVHIRRLRGKLEDSTHSFIDTVRGVGYCFRPTP